MKIYIKIEKAIINFEPKNKNFTNEKTNFIKKYRY